MGGICERSIDGFSQHFASRTSRVDGNNPITFVLQIFHRVKAWSAPGSAGANHGKRLYLPQDATDFGIRVIIMVLKIYQGVSTLVPVFCPIHARHLPLPEKVLSNWLTGDIRPNSKLLLGKTNSYLLRNATIICTISENSFISTAICRTITLVCSCSKCGLCW